MGTMYSSTKPKMSQEELPRIWFSLRRSSSFRQAMLWTPAMRSGRNDLVKSKSRPW
jgi:hypothetical protein